jgi:hypothetical protein
MNTIRRAIATTQALLIFPAILFMGALILRQMSPLQHEPAYTSQQIVMWYAGRMWTLWVLLITLPLVVVVTGCLTSCGAGAKTENFLGVCRNGPPQFTLIRCCCLSVR